MWKLKNLLDYLEVNEHLTERKMNTFSNVYNPYPNNYELALKINNKLNVEVFTEDEAVTFYNKYFV